MEKTAIYGGEMNIYLSFIIGLAIGIVILIVFIISKGSRQAGQLTQEQLIERLKESLKAISFDALAKNTDEFLKLAGETLGKQTQANQQVLENKKGLIEQTFSVMKQRLDEVQKVVSDFEKERRQQFGEISEQLKSTVDQTARLQETTSRIQSALASSRVRGQWGERMAEDILRLAGFLEGVNYRKQQAIESGRPDFTFLLPQDLVVNMDVKFPFDNYLHYLEANGDSDKLSYKEQFLRDVKARIKEVTTRDYINPEQNTIDYVILFIPNEQVYAFIHESDSTILDEALKNKVILCSPLTLYAILAVIRKAIDNFNLERTAGQMLSLFGMFNKQWNMFIDSMDRMGKKIDDARREFDVLISTRRQKLERPLKQIEELRTEKGINIVMLPDDDGANSDES
ncbi:MAG: DNA recombination protein RmuC [Candidatus Omnitrophota bacterium]